MESQDREILLSSHDRLKQIFCQPGAQLLIVAIPGVGTKPPEKWDSNTGALWERLGESGRRPIAVYTFHHDIDLVEDFSWQAILDGGPALLHSLLELRKNVQYKNCPLIFICHSLGGIILKQTLYLATQQPTRFRSLLQILGGVCFMGTPHCKDENMALWQRSLFILKAQLRSVSDKCLNTADIAMLANVCRLFESIDLQCPILSVFETRVTKISRRLRAPKKIILVDEVLAQIKAANETMVPSNQDHYSLCSIERSSATYVELVAFLNSTSDAFLARLEFAAPDAQIPRPVDQLTVKSSFELSSHLENTRSTSLTTANPILDSMSGTSGNFSIMPHATDFTSSAKEARLPCYLISRTRNESFFGRSGVLEVLEEALLPSLPGSSMVDQKNRSLRTFALCGPGGMGKSQTATEFALKHLQRYDAVFWVTADETSKLLEEFSQIAVKIGLVDTGSKDAEDQIVSRDLVKGWLANPIKHLEARESEATWLIIFDNVNDPDILNDFWPVDGTGSILVTSRNPLAKTNVYYAGASGVDLEPFSDDEAAQLLVQLTQKFDDPREVACASAVASRLGGYPLAMAQMAGYISRRHLSFEEFLQRYERDPNLNEIYKNKNSKYRNTYSHNLSTVWALDRLEVGAALLDVLSLLDPDRIDENLLTEGASRCDLEGFPKDEIAYQDARAELLQSSLVSRNLGERRLLIHRIIQDSARARMSPRRLANVFRACIVLVKAVWPFVPLSSIYKVARWTKCEPLFANLVRMKAHFEWIDLKYLDFESKFSFARLMNGAGWYYYERGHGLASDHFLELAQSICESAGRQKIPEETSLRLHTLLSEIHYSRGAAASESNAAKACMMHYSTFLDIWLKLCKQPSGIVPNLHLAVAYNEKGNGYMMSEKYEDAKECYLDSKAAYQQLDGYKDVMASLPVVNLGLAHWLLGELDSASRVLIEGLAAREEEYGIDDNESFETGRLLHALGNVKFSQGKLEESFQYHQRALKQYISTIGNAHHRTGDVCYRVADHYARLGQYRAATNLLDQALKIYADKEHLRPERARTTFKKALVLERTGNLLESQVLMDRAVDLRQLLISGARSKTLPSEADFDRLVVFWSK